MDRPTSELCGAPDDNPRCLRARGHDGHHTGCDDSGLIFHFARSAEQDRWAEVDRRLQRERDRFTGEMLRVLEADFARRCDPFETGECEWSIYAGEHAERAHRGEALYRTIADERDWRVRRAGVSLAIFVGMGDPS